VDELVAYGVPSALLYSVRRWETETGFVEVTAQGTAGRHSCFPVMEESQGDEA
jgi:hypothetical protein